MNRNTLWLALSLCGIMQEAEAAQSTGGSEVQVQANQPATPETAEQIAAKAKSPAAMGERRGQSLIAAEQGIKTAYANEVSTRLDGVIEVFSMLSGDDRTSYIVQVDNVLTNNDRKQHNGAKSRPHSNYIADLRRASAAVEFFVEAKDEGGWKKMLDMLKDPKGNYKDKIKAIPTASLRGGSNRLSTTEVTAREEVKDALKSSGLTPGEQKAAIELAAKMKADGKDITATLSAPPKPDDKPTTKADGEPAKQPERVSERTKAENQPTGEHDNGAPQAPANIREQQQPLPDNVETVLRNLPDKYLWAAAIAFANRLKACDDGDFQNLGATMLDTMSGIEVASNIEESAPVVARDGTNG